MTTANRLLAGAGTQTAGLAFGGTPSPTLSEKYDGTSWTASPSLNIGSIYIGGAGTQTAGLGFGGEIPSGVTARTEEFNAPGFTTKTLTVT